MTACADDHLWDPAAPADAAVAALERVLRPLAHRERPLPVLTARPQRRRSPVLALAAAAAVVLAAVCLAPPRELAPGASERLFVAGTEPARIRLGDLAEIVLDPGSELRFQHWRRDEALFTLQRGRLAASVAPPPRVQAGFFQIDTARGRVVDQGCRYTLAVESDGRVRVEVTDGLVTFAFPARTVWVPAGAVTVVDAGGPSTPRFRSTSTAVAKAVQAFDAATAAADARGREEGLKLLLRAIQDAHDPRDSLVLWHLLRDADEFVRASAEDTLRELVGEPPEPSKGHWDPEVWLPFLRLGAWSQAR